jgi:hypothetical protein
MANDPKANDGVSITGDWRELAQRIQNEADPQKMIELVQQLIDRFDEEKVQKNLPRSADSKSSGSPEA